MEMMIIAFGFILYAPIKILEEKDKGWYCG